MTYDKAQLEATFKAVIEKYKQERGPFPYHSPLPEVDGFTVIPAEMWNELKRAFMWLGRAQAASISGNWSLIQHMDKARDILYEKTGIGLEEYT